MQMQHIYNLMRWATCFFFGGGGGGGRRLLTVTKNCCSIIYTSMLATLTVTFTTQSTCNSITWFVRMCVGMIHIL